MEKATTINPLGAQVHLEEEATRNHRRHARRMQKEDKAHHSKIQVVMKMILMMMNGKKNIGTNGGRKAKKRSHRQAVKIVPSRATLMRIRNLKNG